MITGSCAKSKHMLHSKSPASFELLFPEHDRLGGDALVDSPNPLAIVSNPSLSDPDMDRTSNQTLNAKIYKYVIGNIESSSPTR